MNTTFKGTPGPWEIKHSESKDAWNVIGTTLGGKYKVARCPYVKHDKVFTPDNFNLFQKEREEAEANAKIIAAAPEMLEMLERTAEIMQKFFPHLDGTTMDEEDDYNTHVQLIKQLIQKATI